MYINSASIISPLGSSIESNYKAVIEKVSAIKKQQMFSFDKDFFTSVIDQNQLIMDFSQIGNPDHYTKLEMMCILAIDKCISQIDIDKKSTGIICCSTKGNIDLISTNSFPENRILLDEFATTVQSFFDFKNEPMVVSTACTSSIVGLIIGKRLIKNGIYNNVIVYGGDLVSEFVLSGFSGLGALSFDHCMPLDVNRKGLNLGEASGAIALSNQPNNKHPFLISNGNITNDASHITAPSKEATGLCECISKTGTDVDFVNIHGTGTIYNDAMEIKALKKLGIIDKPIFGIKSIYGHTLGTSGILETIISIEALRQNHLIPTYRCDNPLDDELNVTADLINKEVKSFLKTSAGFGGNNACIKISKY